MKRIKKILNFFMNNKFTIISIALLLFVFTYIYFQINIYITYDGAYYHSYLGYFNGLYRFANWDTVRGPGFPFLLLIFTKLFKDTGHGVLFGLYLFELSFLILSYYIIKRVLKENDYSVPNYVKILFGLLIIFNPYIVGYSHTLLTESIMPLIYVLVGIVCLNFYKYSFKEHKKKFIINSVLLCVLSTISYFIKQPYAPAVWMAIFITAILSGIYYKSFKAFLSKTLIFILALVFTFVSMSGWNLFLKLNGKTNDTTTVGLISGFADGMLYHFEKQETDNYCNSSVLQNYEFSKGDQKKLSEILPKIDEENTNELEFDKSWCSNIDIYNIYDFKRNYVESAVLFKTNGIASVSDTIKFLFKMYIKHPILSMHSYYKNYLAIVNLVNVRNIFNDFTPVGGITYNVSRENDGIAMATYYVDIPNAFWNQDPSYEFPEQVPNYPPDAMKDYVGTTTSNVTVSTLFNLLEPLAKFTFKFLMLFSIVYFIYGLINYIKYKQKQIYFVIVLFSGMAVVSTIFNALYAANIDRYVYVSYTLMLIVLLLTLINKKDLLKEGKK